MKQNSPKSNDHNFITDAKYLEKRKYIEQFYQDKRIIPDSSKSIISPCGKYKLDICQYFTNPNRFKVSRGIVTRVDDGKIIGDIKRNYSHFWYCWVSHPNKNDYLLCGEDYQGYSIVNLTTGKYNVFFPKVGLCGGGFCWINVKPSPNNLLLAVDGCVWAGPYEILICDFSKPEELPYPVLKKIDIHYTEFHGWIDNDTISLTDEIDFRKSDGALYDSLSDEEQEILDEDWSLVDSRTETFQIKISEYKNSQ